MYTKYPSNTHTHTHTCNRLTTHSSDALLQWWLHTHTHTHTHQQHFSIERDNVCLCLFVLHSTDDAFRSYHGTSRCEFKKEQHFHSAHSNTTKIPPSKHFIDHTACSRFNWPGDWILSMIRANSEKFNVCWADFVCIKTILTVSDELLSLWALNKRWSCLIKFSPVEGMSKHGECCTD